MSKLNKLNPDIELNDAVNKIVLWFFSYPDNEIGLSELAKQTGIAKTTAKTVVDVLIEQNFLEKKVIGKAWRLTTNKQHPAHVSRKIPLNLLQIYESGIIKEIVTKYNPKAIVLFGSYRKGEDTEKSDMDIAVEVIDDNPVEIIKLGTIIMGYRGKIPVNLHLFSRNHININLFTNIANGIVLYGLLEVRP